MAWKPLTAPQAIVTKRSGQTGEGNGFEGAEKFCGADEKDSAYQKEEERGIHPQEIPGGGPEIPPHRFGNGKAAIPVREETGTVVMDAAHEDAAEGDPEEGHRAPERPRDRTLDRADAGDVQEPDEKSPRLSHRDIVDAATMDHGRRGVWCTVPEGTFQAGCEEEIAKADNPEEGEKSEHGDA